MFFQYFLFFLLIVVCFANDQNCGKTIGSTFNDDKIDGGRAALRGEVPWQVSLQANISGKYYHDCGGSILNKYWIITAAHCFELSPLTRAVAGTLNINKLDPGSSIYPIDKVIINPEWNVQTIKNDIALVKLKNPIDFESSKGYVNSICLPDPNYIPKGYATASGWGITERGTESDNLLVVDLPIVTKSYCQKKFGTKQIDNTVICAGGIQGKSTCVGDSGGPLFQKVNDTGVLIGIVSYSSNDCGAKGWPDVFTNVSHYLNWINKYINQ